MNRYTCWTGYDFPDTNERQKKGSNITQFAQTNKKVRLVKTLYYLLWLIFNSFVNFCHLLCHCLNKKLLLSTSWTRVNITDVIVVQLCGFVRRPEWCWGWGGVHLINEHCKRKIRKKCRAFEGGIRIPLRDHISSKNKT